MRPTIALVHVVFAFAASAAALGGSPPPVVQIVVDQRTYALSGAVASAVGFAVYPPGAPANPIYLDISQSDPPISYNSTLELTFLENRDSATLEPLGNQWNFLWTLELTIQNQPYQATFSLISSESEGEPSFNSTPLWEVTAQALTTDLQVELPLPDGSTILIATFDLEVGLPSGNGAWNWWYLFGGGAGGSANAGAVVSGFAALETSCRGDLDCDGDRDFADIDYFVAALAGETAWIAKHLADRGAAPTCVWTQTSDVNALGDGLNFLDIDPFVALLGTTCEQD